MNVNNHFPKNLKYQRYDKNVSLLQLMWQRRSNETKRLLLQIPLELLTLRF